ncbi:hypothetical protein BJY52DRAFT_657602 [Lactarius psammicola]|nr:hypothetical protein BJY52DRAFT_657602 [Lactarius psammicola]
MVRHSAYTSGQGVYVMHSGSSLSLASHVLSSKYPNRRTRELPLYRPLKGTPIPVGRLRRRHTYHRLPTFHTDGSHRRNHHHSLLPASSYTSPRDRLFPISPVSVPSRHTTSPTSSIHSRSPPVPPTPLFTKPPVPPLHIMPSYSNPASLDAGPASSTPSHLLPPRSQFYTHLRSVSSFTESQSDYNSSIKLPPNYSASTQAPARGAVERGGVGRSLSIRTTNISHGSGALSARSASISHAVEVGLGFW